MPTAPTRPLTTPALAGVFVVLAGSLAIAQPVAQPKDPRPSEKPQQPATQPANPVPAKDGAPKDKPADAAPTHKDAPAKDGTRDSKDGDKQDGEKKPEASVSSYVLNHTVKDITGKDVDLSTYKGKVVVIVNVASQCGFTPQYQGLEELYESRKDKGLVVLGFPANDFGKQEPGSDAEIKEFCESKFKVTFPMFSKVTVKGEHKAPLYEQLAAQPKPIGGEPKWNFTKFVVDQSGNVVARFDAEKTYVRSSQLEPGLIKKVDELLAAKK